MSKTFRIAYIDDHKNQRRAFVRALNRDALESHILCWMLDVEITRIEEVKR